jgi:hypothetical protein
MKSRLVWTLVQGAGHRRIIGPPVCPALLGQDFEWVRQFRAEVCNSISVDPEAVYLAGSTDGVLPDQTSAGELDAFVRRYDRSGMEVWTRQFGTNASDAACAVSFDASGIYVGGWTAGVFPAKQREDLPPSQVRPVRDGKSGRGSSARTPSLGPFLPIRRASTRQALRTAHSPGPDELRGKRCLRQKIRPGRQRGLDPSVRFGRFRFCSEDFHRLLGSVRRRHNKG